MHSLNEQRGTGMRWDTRICTTRPSIYFGFSGFVPPNIKLSPTPLNEQHPKVEHVASDLRS